MPTHEDHILHILSEAPEPLLPSEIAGRLNREFQRDAFAPMDIVKRLQGMRQKVEKLTDGRWRLKRSRREERVA